MIDRKGISWGARLSIAHASNLLLCSQGMLLCKNQLQWCNKHNGSVIFRPVRFILSLHLKCSKFYLSLLSSTSQKNLPIIVVLFSYHYLYYSHIILYALMFQVLTSRETHIWTPYIFCCSYCVNNSDVATIYT